MIAGDGRAASSAWRTPLVILICGCLIGADQLRAALDVRLLPDADDAANGWGRDVFALALAIQMLLWGAGQPFAGALADRFGAVRVLVGGALLYVVGIVWMAYRARRRSSSTCRPAC